jgi:RNA polymerase sigma-70 factor (ECF subfamily)
MDRVASHSTSLEPAPIRTSPLSDEEIVTRLRAGDTGLYEVIMRRYNQRLFRIARTMLRSDDEAEDVMQEAYVRAYASLDQFAGKAKFSTWLTKISIHEALSRLQKRKRTQQGIGGQNGDDQMMEAVKSLELDPEQQALRNEATSLLEQAVDALPDLYRSVFVLRTIEDMSTAETAACLDLTEEAVKVRLLRSRQMLRRELYARAGATTAQAFQFLGWRCDRMVHHVFEKIDTDNSPGDGLECRKAGT